MARVRFNSKRATQDLLRRFNKVKENKQLQKDIGEFIVARIKAEARRGRPLNDSRKFKPLKSLTIASRKRLAQFNKTHPTFSPRKSNLTFTGQLIDAVDYEVKDNDIFILVADSQRSPIRTGPNSRQRKTPTNQRLQQFLIDISKSFAIFTGKGLKSEPRIAKRVKSIVLRFLRRSLRN